MKVTPVPPVIYTSSELDEDKQRQKGREERTEKAKESKAATIRIGGGGGGGGVYTKSGKYEPLKYAKGGNVASASKRADGCAVRGKTKGKIV